MSYVVSVRRVIGMSEMQALAERDASLHIARQDANTLDLLWSDGSDGGQFHFVQGELQATTPSTAAARKLAAIAKLLDASLVGEEELVPSIAARAPVGIFAGRSTWIGWPVLVIVLAVLLAWRW